MKKCSAEKLLSTFPQYSRSSICRHMVKLSADLKEQTKITKKKENITVLGFKCYWESYTLNFVWKIEKSSIVIMFPNWIVILYRLRPGYPEVTIQYMENIVRLHRLRRLRRLKKYSYFFNQCNLCNLRNLPIFALYWFVTCA